MDKEPEVESAADRTRRLWDDDITSTARKLMEELIKEEAVIVVLLPWIIDRVRATMRTEVRHAEQAAWRNPAGQHKPRDGRVATAVRTQQGALPALDNMELLLLQPVLVPKDGAVKTIPWGKMTIADHQARIGMIGKPLASIEEAIGRHNWAIGEITRYKVSCLNDISVDVLKADLGK